MQLMAMLKAQDAKLAALNVDLGVLRAKVVDLETEVADQAEHIASLIDPLRRRAAPGMKAVNGKS